MRCPVNSSAVRGRVLILLSLCCSDSCKFLHDRSDYKHGWQIERELDEGRYGVNGTAPSALPLPKLMVDEATRSCLLSCPKVNVT